MRIKILRLSVVPGCDGAQVGDVVECLDVVGSQLCGLGRAVQWTGPAPVKRVPFVEEIATRDPVIEQREPEVAVKKTQSRKSP